MSRFEHGICVPPTHPALVGHFPGNPVVPGVVLLDHAIASIEAATGAPVEQLRQVKFLSVVRPGEQIELQFETHGADVRFRAVVQREGQAVPVASGTVSLTGAGGPRSVARAGP